MTSQNDRQTQILFGQIVILAGHCLVTGRYLEPCYGNLLYDKVNLSVLIGSFLVTDRCHGNGHLLCIFVFESRPANSLISRARVPYNKLLTNRN